MRQRKNRGMRRRQGLIAAVVVGILLVVGGLSWQMLRHQTVEGPAESRSIKQVSKVSSIASSKKPVTHPYAVVPKPSFNFILGPTVNAPNTISLTQTAADQYQVVVTATHEIVGKTFAATVSEIPTKTITVFSQGTGSKRSVKVNTKLTLDGRLQAAEANDVYYLFYNRQGTVSLLTPNYAGNVDEADKQVMSEYIQVPAQKDFVRQYLVGKSFGVGPVKYNGQDVGQAMDNNVAPQNTVNDNHYEGMFTADGQVRVHHAHAVADLTMNYTVTDDAVQISDDSFNYTFQDGVLKFADMDRTYPDGSTLTWQLTLTKTYY